MRFEFEGDVASGLGRGEEFVALEGYAEQFQSKLGYEPYPGTLNLEVEAPVRDHLESEESILIEGWRDGDRSFGAVDCYPAEATERDESVPMHVIVPRLTDHDTSVVEIVSPVGLRERFDLEDGSSLRIRM
jgi:riboflavin kinase